MRKNNTSKQTNNRPRIGTQMTIRDCHELLEMLRWVCFRSPLRSIFLGYRFAAFHSIARIFFSSFKMCVVKLAKFNYLTVILHASRQFSNLFTQSIIWLSIFAISMFLPLSMVFSVPSNCLIIFCLMNLFLDGPFDFICLKNHFHFSKFLDIFLLIRRKVLLCVCVWRIIMFLA